MAMYGLYVFVCLLLATHSALRFVFTVSTNSIQMFPI